MNFHFLFFFSEAKHGTVKLFLITVYAKKSLYHSYLAWYFRRGIVMRPVNTIEKWDNSEMFPADSVKTFCGLPRYMLKLHLGSYSK